MLGEPPLDAVGAPPLADETDVPAAPADIPGGWEPMTCWPPDPGETKNGGLGVWLFDEHPLASDKPSGQSPSPVNTKHRLMLRARHPNLRPFVMNHFPIAVMLVLRSLAIAGQSLAVRFLASPRAARSSPRTGRRTGTRRG